MFVKVAHEYGIIMDYSVTIYVESEKKSDVIVRVLADPFVDVFFRHPVGYDLNNFIIPGVLEFFENWIAIEKPDVLDVPLFERAWNRYLEQIEVE